MYEELQRKTRPKPPRCILADGIKGLFGIISPSKLLYEQCRIDGNGEAGSCGGSAALCSPSDRGNRGSEGVKECIQQTYGIIEAVIMTKRPTRPL